MAFPTSPNTGDIYKGYVYEDTVWKRMDPERAFKIGYIYIQYPGKQSPSELGYYGTWENKSAECAGDFFRAEGGNAVAFGTGRQGMSTNNVSTMETSGNFSANTGTVTVPESGWSGRVRSGMAGSGVFSIRLATSGAETRPVNQTIRIWERVS